jgi:signal transduction histidine kinase
MAERASSGLRSGELLLRLVAHELRTPLTKAGFALELLRSADTDAARDTQIGRLSTAHADLARLIDAVEDRMSVAHSIARARLTPVRVDDCARDALAMVDVDLELVERLDPLTLPGDAELLVRLVRNLVENAARHADSWVLVTVTANPPRIEVADDGPGIAEDQRALVLQPFVRSGSGGVSGLGLPIAASVAQLHRGELTLGTSSRGGLSVTIAFETTRSGVAGPPPAVAG